MVPAFLFQYPQEFILHGENNCFICETWEIQADTKATTTDGFSGSEEASFLISPDQCPASTPPHPDCPL